MALLTLPNELLVAIAAAGWRPTEDPLQRRHKVSRRRYKCEWAMSQVSRRLRDVIIGAPTLWTLVELDLHHEDFMDIAQLYLTRSRACHLSVLFYETKDINSDDLIAQRISALVPHLSRIKKLHLSLYTDPEVTLSPLRHVPAPNLERLAITSSIANTSPFEIFSPGLPRLTFLSMKHVAPSLPLPPWTGALTRLEFHSDDMSLVATIIAQCPSLAHLSLGMVYHIIPRLHMPSLKFLCISILDYQDQDYLLTIFDLFDAPALTEFMINGTHADQILVLFNSTSLPQSFFPALTSLTFANSSDEECSFIGEVHPTPPSRLFPILSSLSFIRQCFTSTLVHALLLSAAHTWPLLKTLTMCPVDREVSAVSDTLWRARTAKPRTLPRFKLSSSLLAGMRKREKENDEESGLDMELFDPTELIAAFQ
ncbi:hypothetical protein C8R46DRAFT_300321 [Mycena filopes]|nr:hypothetical protein C8R46DRAFT_300321 [Mycena filopes]